jgi:hypothetical protein
MSLIAIADEAETRAQTLDLWFPRHSMQGVLLFACRTALRC